MRFLDAPFFSIVRICCIFFGAISSLYAQSPEDLSRDATLSAEYSYMQGSAKKDDYQLDSAIYYFEQAIAHSERAGNTLLLIDAYNELSRILTETGRYEEVKPNIYRALQVARQSNMDDHSLLGRTYQLLGSYYIDLGIFDSAEHYLNIALKNRVRNFGVNSPEVDDIYYSFCRLHFFQDDYEEVDKYVKLVMSGTREYDSYNIRLAHALNVVAIIYYLKADYFNAKVYFEQGLKKFGKDEIPWDMNLHASMLENLGAAEFLSGNYEQANQYYHRVLEWRKKYLPGNHRYTSSSYYDIAEVHDRRGEHDQAIKLLKKCIQMRYDLYNGPHQYIAKAFSLLGTVYFHKGENELALESFRSALKMNQQLGEDFASTADLFQQLGTLFQSIESYDSAEYYYNQSLDLLERKYGTVNPRVAQCLLQKAEMYNDMGELELSILELRKALSTVAKVSADHLTINDVIFATESIDVLKSRASTLRQAYHEGLIGLEVLDEALDQIRLAIDLIMEKRLLIFDKKAQLEFAKQYVPVYDEGLQLITLLYQQNRDEKYMRIAFEIMEGSKAFALTRETMVQENSNAYPLPIALLDKERELKVDISYYQQQILELKSRSVGYDTVLMQRYEDQLFELKRDFETLKVLLASEHPEYHQLKYDLKSKPLTQIQQVLDIDEILVEYYWSATSVYRMI